MQRTIIIVGFVVFLGVSNGCGMSYEERERTREAERRLYSAVREQTLADFAERHHATPVLLPKKWTPKPGQRLKWNLHRVSGRRAEAGCAEVHHIWRPPTK